MCICYFSKPIMLTYRSNHYCVKMTNTIYYVISGNRVPVTKRTGDFHHYSGLYTGHEKYRTIDKYSVTQTSIIGRGYQR